MEMFRERGQPRAPEELLPTETIPEPALPRGIPEFGAEQRELPKSSPRGAASPIPAATEMLKADDDGEGHLGRTEWDSPAGRRTCCIPWLSRFLCAHLIFSRTLSLEFKAGTASWALLPGVGPNQTKPSSMSHK